MLIYIFYVAEYTWGKGTFCLARLSCRALIFTSLTFTLFLIASVAACMKYGKTRN